MSFSIAKFFAAITPVIFLPIGTKLINGEIISLNPLERREFFERNLGHRFNKLLDKYSPIRRSVAFWRDQRLKRKQNQFYCLMGQIALTHAGIEQDIKNTLLVDWDVPKEFEEGDKKIIIEKHFGEKLKKRFFKELKKRLIPEDKVAEYETLYKQFWTLSEKRNDSIKAIYAFNKETSEMFQIHEKNHALFDKTKSYEEMVKAWMPEVSLITLKNLLNDLQNVRGKFLKLRAIIFREKIRLHSELCSEIGRNFPGYAFKNPYLYQAQIDSKRKQ